MANRPRQHTTTSTSPSTTTTTPSTTTSTTTTTRPPPRPRRRVPPPRPRRPRRRPRQRACPAAGRSAAAGAGDGSPSRPSSFLSRRPTSPRSPGGGRRRRRRDLVRELGPLESRRRAERASKLSAPDGIAPFVMTDEEGGLVQRMANLVGSIPSAREMGATMTPAQIRQLATDLAVRMRAAGRDDGPRPRAGRRRRARPQRPRTRTARGRSAPTRRQRRLTASRSPAASQAGGVVPVVKHFPGLGGATGNTDVMSASTPPWSTLQKVGPRAFRGRRRRRRSRP